MADQTSTVSFNNTLHQSLDLDADRWSKSIDEAQNLIRERTFKKSDRILQSQHEIDALSTISKKIAETTSGLWGLDAKLGSSISLGMMSQDDAVTWRSSVFEQAGYEKFQTDLDLSRQSAPDKLQSVIKEVFDFYEDNPGSLSDVGGKERLAKKLVVLMELYSALMPRFCCRTPAAIDGTVLMECFQAQKKEDLSDEFFDIFFGNDRDHGRSPPVSGIVRRG